MPDNEKNGSKPKPKPTSKQIKQKYSNNPYVTGGREQWGEYLESKTLPFSGSPVKKAIYNAANTTKINPDLLYASAMEEGLREGIDDPNAVSEAYQMAIGDITDTRTGKKQQQFDPNQFPVDGFRTYGLDTFGDQFESLQRKGYLPEGFDKRFTKFKALNEIEEKKKKEGKDYNYINTAAFKSEDDALIAKAAMLRSTRDNLNNYSKKTNVPLTDKQRDFFTLVGYNAGEGNMQKMIKSYKDKGYLKDDKFLTDTKFKPASFSQPYTYAQRRLQNMQVLDTEGYFQDYTPPNQQPTVTSDSMQSGGIISQETPDQKLARYQAIYGNAKAKELINQENFALAQQALPAINERPLYEPSESIKRTKAGLSALSLGTGMGSNPLSYLANVAGSVYDFGTAAKYAMDDQWAKAGEDAIQGLVGLIPSLKGQKNVLKGIRALQAGNDVVNIGEAFNDGGGLSRSKDYGSKKKPYPSVSKGDFAGGGRSYPIPTKADAIDALRLAGLHGRSDVRAKVFKKYPDLKKNEGGYLAFNSSIYNDLYPNGKFTNLQMNNGGSIYDQPNNGFNPIAKKRQDPFTPYAEIANFGYGDGFYTEAVANDGIHINPANKGKFNATKKRTGKSTEELTHSKNPLTRKRAIFAQNARHFDHSKGDNGLNLPFRPNMVSTEEDPIYSNPLEEANRNITNYFNNPQNNQIINDATLDFNPDLQGEYQDQGFSSTEAGQDTIDNTNEPSTGQRIGQFASKMLSGVSINTAPLIMGTAAIANLATRGQQESQEYARRVRRYSQQDVYNPIKYGTGSQAIFNNGGSINGVKTLSDNQFSSPIAEFVGPSHEEGGIDINYQGQNIEVEGGETIFMDNDGDLNVFGNMYIPGTNKKFKTISKNIANTENKTQYNLDKSVDLVNSNNPTIKYQKYKFNAGKVMMGANKEKLEELNEIKNELSSMQNLMLQQGYTEDSSEKLNYGGKMKYDLGGEIFDNGRGKRKTSSRTPQTKTPAVELMKGPINPIVQPQINPPALRTTPIQQMDYTPPIIESDVPQITRDVPKPNMRRSSMPIGQILPEILTIATERPEFVPGQTYEPDLYTPYQVTFQDRLNENNATFRAMQINNSNNPALMSQLAAQKYEADSRVLADEFRTNQGIQNQITNQNIELLNQAQLQNIQLTDQQMVRQSQARSNTRENVRNAINSISSKANQARLEDQTLAVYENMFPHFTFDNNGKLKFQDVERPVFTSGLPGGNVLPDSQRTKVKYDEKGKVKETTVSTPSRKDQDKLDLQINKARTQRLGLFNSIFGGKTRR